jgi:hypothetical protein
MSGKSLRKAFRKLFRLRKASSESRINTHGTITWNSGNPDGPKGPLAALSSDHHVVDRSRSHGKILHWIE